MIRLDLLVELLEHLLEVEAVLVKADQLLVVEVPVVVMDQFLVQLTVMPAEQTPEAVEVVKKMVDPE